MTDNQTQKREVPIYTHLDERVLNRTMIDDLTWVAFRLDRIAHIAEPLDTLVTMSTPIQIDRQATAVRNAVHAHQPDQLILSGGMPWHLPHLRDVEPNLGQPQSIALYREILAQDGKDLPRGVNISVETQSKNTKENAEYIWEALPRVPVGTLGVLTKNFHVGRSLDTVDKVASNKGWEGKIVAIPYSSSQPDYAPVVDMAADTWPQHEIARARVFGEFKRISTYGPRGDIAFSPGHAERVARIDETLTAYHNDHKNGRTVTVSGADLSA